MTTLQGKQKNEWIKIHRVLTQTLTSSLAVLQETRRKEIEECFGRPQSEDRNFTWGFCASDACHSCNGGKMIGEEWSRNPYATETSMSEFEMEI